MKAATPIARALSSLEGLALGDALGERFFGYPTEVMARIAERRLPDPTWTWTDDTLMACSIVAVLAHHGEASPEVLAESFATRFDVRRGYGGAAADLLGRIRAGAADWRSAGELFGGAGSYGNGAAMRVAPLGAFFCDDLGRVVREADRSALATHTHDEARAGAVAVAVAAAISARGDHLGASAFPAAFLRAVAEHTPGGSRVRDGLERAAGLPSGTAPDEAAHVLGSGQEVAAHDTVPFALWAVAGGGGDFEETFWRAVAGLGDCDTTAAIACGVVAAGGAGLPEGWRAARERLPQWVPRATEV